VFAILCDVDMRERLFVLYVAILLNFLNVQQTKGFSGASNIVSKIFLNRKHRYDVLISGEHLCRLSIFVKILTLSTFYKIIVVSFRNHIYTKRKLIKLCVCVCVCV